LLLPLPVLAIVLLRGGERRGQALALLGVAGLATALANGAWVVPMLRYLHWRSPVPLPLWTQHDPLRIVRGLVTAAAGFDGFDAREWLGTPLAGSWLARDLVTALGIAGIWLCRERRLAAAIGIAIAWLALLAFYGSWIGAVAAFEPFRYVIAYRAM